MFKFKAFLKVLLWRAPISNERKNRISAHRPLKGGTLGKPFAKGLRSRARIPADKFPVDLPKKGAVARCTVDADLSACEPWLLVAETTTLRRSSHANR